MGTGTTSPLGITRCTLSTQAGIHCTCGNGSARWHKPLLKTAFVWLLNKDKARLVLLFVVTVQTAMLFDKLRHTCQDKLREMSCVPIAELSPCFMISGAAAGLGLPTVTVGLHWAWRLHHDPATAGCARRWSSCWPRPESRLPAGWLRPSKCLSIFSLS